MEFFYISVAVVLLAAVVALLLRSRFYKRQIHSFTKQTRDRIDLDMNHPVTTDSFGKEFVELANALNNYTNRQKKTIEEAENDRQNLKMIVAGISHDFRTPLTASLGYLQMIERRGVLDGRNQEYLKIAIEKNLYLKSLSDEFFAYSLLDTDSGEKEQKLIPFKSLLENITLGQYPVITDKGLDFSAKLTEEEVYLRAAEQDIIRIIENLYSNATKYAKKKLTLTYCLQNGNICLSMENDISDGTEICTEHLFEPFFRHKDGSQSGNGLGLYVAKQLAEKYGGKMTAVITEGSRFRIDFILPIDNT
ncbi:MAG: HAMP domain-containing histidine kinase [Clostridia bacterium]|nr:HAMP domain-containing histidine kinase [Clostridia bacterium]